jgi:predicted RNA-binding protein with PUA-like domain
MYWLLKTEPTDYAYADLAREGTTAWTGVKNFQAIGNLKKVQAGDELFIYHTGKEKAIIGVAQAVSSAYTHNNGDTVIDIKAMYPLKRAVTLAEIKADARFAEWELVRLPRLSVMPVSAEHWQLVHEVAGIVSVAR